MDINSKRHHYEYFNCIRHETAMILMSREVPIDLLFYNAFENTGVVFQQMVKIKNRTKIKTKAMSFEDFHLIGVNYREKTYKSFDQVEKFILEYVDSNNTILLRINPFFLPHYKELHENNWNNWVHYIIVDGHNYSDGNESISIIDDYMDNVYIHRQYDKKYIKDAVECYDDYHLGYFEISPILNKQRLINEVKAKYQDWLKKFQDDFSFYESICNILLGREEVGTFKDEEEMFKVLDETLMVISASRCLFADFLKFIHYKSETIHQLLDCYQKGRVIRNVIKKYKITGKIDITSLENRCLNLKGMENDVISSLRGHGEFDLNWDDQAHQGDRVVLT